MTKNILYYGDNLDILRHYIPDESVDLIYLDPPFNSSRNYNVLFRESNGTAAPAQIRAFEDSWTWDRKAVETLEELTQTTPASLVNLLNAFVPFLGHSPMMTYLVMMAIRLVELRRVLKPTGSIYLHCDPTASHYLKMVMDGIFGSKNFRNEIIWQRTTAGKPIYRNLPKNADHILWFTKTGKYKFIPMRQPLSEQDIATFTLDDNDGRGKYNTQPIINPADRPNLKYVYKDMKGREWYPPKTGWRFSEKRMRELEKDNRLYFTKSNIREKYYLSERTKRGKQIPNIWIDIPPTSKKESLGYPTQKPIALLQRIIQAASDEGDIILDPFCGCGTTIDAAQHLGRRWIGIDVTHIAISLIRRRLRDRYEDDVSFDVIGEPKDEGSARALAEQDRYQFQSWALDQIDARPSQEVKGADQGIDGVIFFRDDKETIRRVLVQVKSGHVGVGLIRNLVGTLKRENDEKDRTPIGIFLTLEQPTKPMIREAVSAGSYRHPLNPDRKFPRIQILTVRDLFDGKKPDLPYSKPLTYTKAGAAPRMKTQERLKL